MKDLLKSKKFKTMILGIIGVVAIKVAGLKGIVLDEATAKALSEMVFGLASAYLLAQGAADFGKSKQELLSGAVELAKSAGVSADAVTPSPEPESPAEAAAAEAPKTE